MHKYLKFILTVFFSLLLFWVATQFSSPLFAQTREEPLRYEVEVVLIEIPLYMTDKEGNPVKNLRPEEVSLYENGKKQKISHFVLVQNDSPQLSSLARVYPSARRQFLLLFDFAFATSARIIKAREACLKFVKEKIFPTDLVAVASYSGIGGLKILSHFTSDRNQLFYIVNSLGLVESKQRMTGPVGFTFPSVTQPSREADVSLETKTVRDMADEELRELQNKLNKKRAEIYKAYVADFITDLNSLSIALNTIKGRKHIIYFSEGFDSKVLTGKSLAELSQDTDAFLRGELFTGAHDIEGRFGDAALRMQLYDALKKISSADCPVHTIDIGGLRTQAGAVSLMDDETRDLAAIRRGQDTLSLFSSETGGQVYKNVNELDEPLENLLKITNTYYILGYYPEDKKKEGKFRKIKIETTRRDVEISYRMGYYEAKPYQEFSNLEKRLQLVEYIVKDIPTNQIQFDSYVSAFRGKAGICQVPVFLKFPGTQFLEKKEIQLEIYGYAITNSGVFRDFFHQDLTISPEKTEEKLELCGIKYYDLHLLPPGDYKIKLIVRDKDTGKIGSQFHELSVPDYDKGELGMSGPVFFQPEPDWLLSRGFDPDKPTGRKLGLDLPVDYPYVWEGKPFIPGVAPVLQAASPAQFYIRIYNLRLHPHTQAPQTEMNFEIVDREGNSTPLKNVGLLQNPNQPEPGVFELLFQANFSHLASGPYLLKLSFKDSLAKQELVSSTPFILE
jgi:VWFA-related protein